MVNIFFFLSSKTITKSISYNHLKRELVKNVQPFWLMEYARISSYTSNYYFEQKKIFLLCILVIPVA